jgi:putative membrane protein
MTQLAPYYLWIKALHIVSVIAWMAGLLYLPRLYVYHADTKPGSELSEKFKIMERRLLRGIVNPSMVAVFVFGILLAGILGSEVAAEWFYLKIALVLVLAALHGQMARWRKEFERDERVHTARFFRIMNEIPTVLMIAIVILAVVKPF